MSLIGKQAPDFKLEGVYKAKFDNFDLGDYKGKWLVIFFYPLDFTFICPTEIKEFSKQADEFKEIDCEIVGVSTDSKNSHKKWIETELGELNFPLLADLKKEMCLAYDCLKEDEGVAFRATFIIDSKGVIRHETISDNDVGRSVTETLRVVKALQTGKLCPVEWKEGEKTLN
ncbi:MAG TPA: peroxiredoxin [Candidatus Paceibacterota bacterium]